MATARQTLKSVKLGQATEGAQLRHIADAAAAKDAKNARLSRQRAADAAYYFDQDLLKTERRLQAQYLNKCLRDGNRYLRVVAIEWNGDIEEQYGPEFPNRFQAKCHTVNKHGGRMNMRVTGTPYGLHERDFLPDGTPNFDEMIAAFGRQPDS